MSSRIEISSSNAKIADDCQICLGSLSTHDKEYPILCPSKCSCNICFNCTSHLVKMRKTNNIRQGGAGTGRTGGDGEDDVMTLCPRCQDDLSYTIEDTFLIRKSLKMGSDINDVNVPDSELSAAELRFKHSVTPQQIEEAKNRLNQFEANIESGNISPRTSPNRKTYRRKVNVNNNDSRYSNDSSINTNTKTNTAKNKSMPSSQLMKLIGCDFFNGMQDILSEAEQTFVSELMTSGDVEKLVQASQILYELKRIHQDPNTNNATDLPQSSSSSSSLITTTTTTSSSSTKTEMKLTDAEKRALRMSLSKEEKRKLEGMERYLDMNPLPPMPKCVTLDADFDLYAKHRKVLKFRDDIWNGTVSDAFARVYTSDSNTTSSYLDGSDSFDSNFVGYHNNEEGGFVNGNKRKSRQNRVIIYAARKQVAKLGVEAGDVVTHFDGNEFLGTASDLKILINDLYVSGNKSFSMVLNAEQITADALKDCAVELQSIN
jgi:hypothetical protein